MKGIPIELQGVRTMNLFEEEGVTKALGLSWLPEQDKLVFTLQKMESPPKTKRAILSEIAKIYDPLGLLSPIIIRNKIFMQKLWTCNIGWDTEIPQDLFLIWEKLYNDLDGIDQIMIDMCRVLRINFH